MAVTHEEHAARIAAECERALLGALIRYCDVAWPLVKDSIAVSHFARADHRLIFSAITSLIAEHGRCDPALLIDHLGPGRVEAAGGRDYLFELVAECTSGVSAALYAEKIREQAGVSNVVDFGAKLAARPASVDDTADMLVAQAERLKRDYGTRTKPFETAPASQWADVEPPPAREWILEGMIPAGRVTSLFGNGGLGKTLIALQIALHVSMGREVFGLPVKGGPVLGIFCEDEEDELNRRIRAACAADRVNLADAERLYAISRDGDDSVLCTFEHDHIRLTAFYKQLDATIAALNPALVILDTAADLFAGDFMSTPHVRQFIKIALGGLCKRHGCAVLLLAHPSKAGLASGEGDGFSTAWSNSVRSRLYLSQPKPPEGEGSGEAIDISDKRVLEVKKSNYGRKDVAVPLTYADGYFVRDEEPVIARSSMRANATRIQVAALDYLRSRDPLVVDFREVFDTLQAAGEIPPGPYDVRRKPLFRALDQLIADGLVRKSTTPRGYRVVQ